MNPSRHSGFARGVLRKLRYVVFALAALIVLAAVAVVRNETSCINPRVEIAPFHSALEAAQRREEVNSYLTYPEWSIVHAYEDLAAVTRRGSESDFAYFAGIGSYWSSLCSITLLASSRGAISLDYKVMLYTIGLSFAAEMGAKGAYELTIGRVTAWIRGPKRTAEDEFALAVADDYAAFLRQTPWYEYPFASKLAQFWTTTPVSFRNPIRSLERRISLSFEYAFKAVYAKLIGLGAAATPAPLTIRSVVKDLDPSDLAVASAITLIGKLPDGGSIIETPRYRAFTDILRKLAGRGRNLAEIAGNDDILVTVLASPGAGSALPDARQLFAVAVQARPGWQRLGFDVRVASLLDLMRRIEGTNIELEHVYDY